jgi:hypothetical protein
MSRRTDQLERMYGVNIEKLGGYNYSIEFKGVKTKYWPLRLHEVITVLKELRK